MLKQISKIIIIIIIFLFNFNITYGISEKSNPTYEGIDVSNWQKYIDYSKVKQSGINIVYIKASQGTTFKDPYFESNYKNAKANGLKVGFYHFLTATTVTQAEKEAEFFSSVISGKEPDCKLVMDYEIFNGVGRNEINKIAQAFLNKTYQLTKKELIIYSNLYNSNNTFNNTLANNYELWLAYYASNAQLANATSNWNNWIGWQYTNKGIVNGINGYVDRDKYTKEIFLGDTSKIEVNDKPNDFDNTNVIIYTVKRGDTLWAIARKYGTTVNQIVNTNGISNPNLIYPGQILKINTQQYSSNIEEGEAGCVTYTVQKGDTLSEIAFKHGVTIAQIQQINNIKNINLIYPGEQFRIPIANGLNACINNNSNIIYKVKKGDTLWSIAQRYGKTVNYLVRINGIQNPNLIYPGQLLKI